MARTTTRRTHRAPGSKTARRSRKTPIRSQTPQRKRAPSRSPFERRNDLLGGGLLAAGVFLACVEWLGWNGGVIGGKIDGLLRLLVGGAAVAVPLILLVAGAAVFLDSPMRHLRPLRAGVIAAMATLVLALSTTDTADAEQHGGL